MEGRLEASDEELMAAFLAGDERAFEALFDRHAGPVRAMLTRLTGSEAIAAELTQETFVSVVRGRGRFVPGSTFRPWVYAIAWNAFRDHHRRAKREVLTRDGILPEAIYETAWRDVALQRKLQTALDRLPDGQREAVLLHRILGLGFVEIAEMLGLTESAAKVRAHRGYLRLRRALRGHRE